MKVHDPLSWNDWEIKKFLSMVLIVQSTALLVIAIEGDGSQLPILRQLVCFIYLAFIPGALILRALNLHKLGSVQSLLFTIGSSLAVLMFTGLALNTVMPYAGISTPISIVPIMMALSLCVSILCIICYVKDKKVSDPAFLDTRLTISPPAILLYIVPFLAILGAYLMNYSGANTLLVLLIVVIAGIVLLIGFDHFIPKELYPLAIFVIALSLVFHNSLISSYVSGWDIHMEKYYATLVIDNGIWDSSMFNVLNAMLSIVMLAPIFSIVMNLDIIWVFKIIYPFLFAFVPLGIFEIFKRQAGDKIAFLSVFFFVSLVVFYTELIQLARQEIAELFVVLVIMLIVDRGMSKLKWSALFVIFSFSLVLSHYGLTYIFIASLVVVWAVLYLNTKIHLDHLGEESLNRRLSVVIILSLIIFCLIWYIYTARANPFITILSIVSSILSSLSSRLLDPVSVQGMALIASGGSVSILHKIYLYLMIFTQLMIVIGIVSIGLKRDKVIVGKEYYAFSLIMLAILMAGITVPFFASALNTTRLYQIALIFLAIFFVIGWLSVFKLLERVVGHKDPKMPLAFKTLAIFLVVFLVFNTGLVFEVFKDVPNSYSLNRTVDNMVYTTKEVVGTTWVMSERDALLIDNKTNEYYLPPIYGDQYRLLLFEEHDADQISDIKANSSLFNNSYVYLGTYNVDTGRILIVEDIGVNSQATYTDASNILGDRGRVYSNGGSDVYYKAF